MNVLNSTYKKIFFLNLLIILLLYNCDNSNSWTQTEKENLIAKCVKAGKNKVSDDLKIKDICECSIGKFSSEFSLKEYKEIQAHEVLSIDLNNRLNLIIELITEDCEIFYDSSISVK